jgi:undecaprenyl-diphosphatase
VTLAVLILLGWGMGVLVLHVAPGVFHAGLDRPVNRWVHAHHSRGLHGALGGVAHLGSETVVLAVALVAGVIWAARRRHAAPLVALGLASTGGAAITLAVKLAVHRGQSEASGGLAGLTELGFPSGHATLSAAVYGTAAFLLSRPAGHSPAHDRSPAGRWLRAAAVAGLVALAITIGVARVYNGQHETTDVLAGWMLGGLWARAVYTRYAPGVKVSGRARRPRRTKLGL